MTIKKVKGIESDFSILPNSMLNDSLSWDAKGLLAYLCSKPADWTVSVAQLCNHSKESERPTGRDKTYSIIDELMKKGYIQRVQSRSNGSFSSTDYIVSCAPININPALVESPLTEIADTVSSDTAETTQQSKDKNKEQIKDLSSSIEPEPKDPKPEDLVNTAFDNFWMKAINRARPLPVRGLKNANRPGALKFFKIALQKHKNDPMALSLVEEFGSFPHAFAEMLIRSVADHVSCKTYGIENSIHPQSYINGERWNDDLSCKNPNEETDINRIGKDFSAPANWNQ